ncbi:MAG: UDP-N-acetylmuramoyl-L-alanine--D-glutamate ligase [Candidatus Staskawiczbacteria bacterium]|nr:UDP-N-acetylmuramoyl-L-alanine--D-glutamate ligase [Candidatus Staskawiczbacteria bacterium]
MDLKAIVFEFTSYDWDPEKKRVVFKYKTEFTDGREPIIWTECIVLPSAPDVKNIPQGLLNNLLQSLHIVLGISYWKFYCATNIELPYNLSKQEADFWNIVYKKGLGEFFYKNSLDPKHSPNFPFSKTKKVSTYPLIRNGKSLVGIGGGKDSIVSAELLKQARLDATSFHIETGKPSKIVDDVIETVGVGSLKIQRFLDWQVHQPHQYNGHIPISAIYAFLGIFSAVLYHYDYVIVSNEHSSNFGNITYKGLEVNHQWSKSFEFETLFSDYVKNIISPDVKYVSLLRSFYEIRIVEIFSKMKKYFPLFSSCNKNFTAKGNEQGKLWCGVCAKCVFAFTLLSAFVPRKELTDIFGKNLYEEESLLPLFKDVLGFGTMKPFDCVGTFEEAQTALFLTRKKFAQDYIVRQIGGRVKYHKEVFEVSKNNAIPEQFKFLGAKNAYILGYGKEGKITKQYIKKQYPKLKIGIGDGARDQKYLEKQIEFDIAIKTPGIKKELVTIPYTTATNIFFSNVLGKNLIIGVTGSKGKSTTSSLIYHILKTAAKNVELLGNIGKPMLEALLKPIPKDRIFVLELSSYQLDDIKFSPDITVVTNLFPEHMDFHGSLKAYYEAKKNIINFQNPENFFVYNQKSAGWLKNYKGRAVIFSAKKFESNLIGEHNQSNIGSAVAVAEILKIPQEKIKKAIKSFKVLEHRLENVGTFKGITFYDDAISTTPESTIMAIKAIKNVDTIFLGGQDRGYDFKELEKIIKKSSIRNVVLFPDSGNNMLKQTKDLNILKTRKMEEAVRFAYKNTKRGSVCLLSCASPSYSLWKNFEVKGDEFKKFVKKLAR